MKQTAVGMGSQGSSIQVEHFQFLGYMMGAARTWVSLRPFGVDTRRSRLSNKPKMGHTLQLKPMA